MAADPSVKWAPPRGFTAKTRQAWSRFIHCALKRQGQLPDRRLRQAYLHGYLRPMRVLERVLHDLCTSMMPRQAVIDKSLYIAMTGASATLRAQAGVAQNIANSNTVGFQALLNGTVASPVAGAGFASRVATTIQDLGTSQAPGATLHTGNPLDVRLGQGKWLAVQDAAGGIAYTRAGDLQITPNGLLTTANGQPVLGSDGAPMALPSYDSVNVAGDGTISIVPQGQPASTISEAGRLQIVAIEPTDVTHGDDGLVRPRAGTTATPAAGKVLTSGAVEGSNVDGSAMLVSMIELARKFEMQVNLLKNGDETAKAANSLLASS